ncbi:hypothetical protein [Streptomyces sp. ITFR-6]|uniref:hypothetical protein n=1 Tax=Streptomyces sp. ITFR-6 TaxID=3075197 RepID=UPI00288B5146|nr:hypothetical protein [Streptomyces sp. ITFR-6]WNI29662.1 hypothetical protein RLT59_13325 [Streptomyces sp. ITFR-6]
MTTNPHRQAREHLLERWLDDMQVLAGRLEQVHLADGFPFDYSPASLAPLEEALLAEGPDADFRRAAIPYLGEILMDVCGGRWDVDPEAGGEDGEPFVRPDPALGLEPLFIGTLIDLALAEESGEALTREYEELAEAVSAWRLTAPGRRPEKERSPLDPIGPQPVDAWLLHWLTARRDDHPAWVRRLSEAASPAAAEAAAAEWDFSQAGLDALERQVRARYRTPAELDAGSEADGPFLPGAVWYLGEVIRRHHDSTWVHWAMEPDAPRGSHHHPDNPWSGIPFTHQPHKRRARPCDPRELLRGLIRYGADYHLDRVIADI